MGQHGKHKKISLIFCMKFCTTVLMEYTLHFAANFGWNISGSDKIMVFPQRQPNWSSFRALSSPALCWWLWKEPVCWWWDEDADLEMNRITADAWSDHHLQSQPIYRQLRTWWSSPPPCWCVVVHDSPSQMVCKATINWWVILVFGWVYGTFPEWRPRRDSPAGFRYSPWKKCKPTEWFWRARPQTVNKVK